MFGKKIGKLGVIDGGGSGGSPATPCVLDIDLQSYASKAHDFTSQEGTPYSFCIADSGTKAYIVGSANDTVYQYTLSTAWDISSASYASKSYNPSERTDLYGVRLKPDGTKLYLCGPIDGSNTGFHQYTLSTPFDVSTASYDSKTSSVALYVYSFHMKSDGTEMLLVNYLDDSIYRYSLSTAWDISTMSSASDVLDPTTDGFGYTNGCFMSEAGDVLLVCGRKTGIKPVRQYLLSTAWDLSTASLDCEEDVSEVTNTDVEDVFASSDCTTMYVLDQASDNVYQYDL